MRYRTTAGIEDPETDEAQPIRRKGRPLTSPKAAIKREQRKAFRESAQAGLEFALNELKAGRLAQVTDKVAMPPKWSRTEARDFNNAKLAMVGRWITYRKHVLSKTLC